MSHRSAVTFDTVCLILFVSCVLPFRLSLRLCFPSVSNFYFTSQYNQFPLSHASAAAAIHTYLRAAAAAIHTYPRAAAAAATTTPLPHSTEIPPKTRKT